MGVHGDRVDVGQSVVRLRLVFVSLPFGLFVPEFNFILNKNYVVTLPPTFACTNETTRYTITAGS